ncbi:MAG: hypothetical protein V4494_07005 [Chlamydiota bacterium]
MLRYLFFSLLSLSCSIAQASTPSQASPPVHSCRTPLRNLSSFAVLPIFALSNPTHAHLYEQTYQILKTELGKIGEIQELKMNNLAGLTLAGAFLAINIENITIPGSNNISITKTSLAIETMTTIKKSDVDYLAHIWERNLFTEDDSDKTIIASIQKLVQQFTACYQTCNTQEPKKPTFYLYKS